MKKGKSGNLSYIHKTSKHKVIHFSIYSFLTKYSINIFGRTETVKVGEILGFKIKYR